MDSYPTGYFEIANSGNKRIKKAVAKKQSNSNFSSLYKLIRCCLKRLKHVCEFKAKSIFANNFIKNKRFYYLILQAYRLDSFRVMYFFIQISHLCLITQWYNGSKKVTFNFNLQDFACFSLNTYALQLTWLAFSGISETFWTSPDFKWVYRERKT